MTLGSETAKGSEEHTAPERSHWPVSLLGAAGAAVNVLLPLWLVRDILPEEVGIFKTFFLYASIMPTLAMVHGVVNGLYYWAGQGEGRHRAFLSSSTLVVGAAIAMLCVCLLAMPWIAAGTGWSAEVTLLFALSVAASVAAPFFEEASVASGHTWSGALFQAGFELARTFAILATAIATSSLVPIFTAHTVVLWLKLIVGLALGRRRGFVGIRYDRDVLRKVLAYAAPVSLAAALSILVEDSDRVWLSMFVDPAEYAAYAIGCLALPPLYILEHSVARVLIPQLSRAFFEGEAERAAALYRRAVDDLASVLLPATAGLFVFAEPIIELLFTSRYQASASILRWFSFSYLALCLPHDAVARARGDSRWLLTNYVLLAVLSLPLGFVLVHSFGAAGGLATLLTSRCVQRIFGFVYSRRATGWSAGQFIPFRGIALYSAVCVLLSLVSLLVRPFFATDQSWFWGAGLSFAGVYGLFFLRSRAGLLATPTSADGGPSKLAGWSLQLRAAARRLSPPFVRALVHKCRRAWSWGYTRCTDVVQVLDLPLTDTVQSEPCVRTLRADDQPAIDAGLGRFYRTSVKERFGASIGVGYFAEDGSVMGYAWATAHERHSEGASPFLYDVLPGHGQVYIYDVYVSPPLRGRHAARALLVRLLQEASRAGSKQALLTHDAEDVAMVRLCKGLGFCAEGRITYRRRLGQVKVNTQQLEQVTSTARASLPMGGLA